MTPEQLAELEAARERREDELILLLLLLLGHGLIETAGDPDPLPAFRRLLTVPAATEIAESMADMHRDAFPIYRPGMGLPDRDELVRLYAPTGREASAAMLDTIAEAIVAAGGDVALGLRQAGYSRSNARGLELGAERNVVTASNAGLLAAAVTFGEVVTGLSHLSTIDDATTDICRPRHRLQLPVLDGYWRRNWPSLHWRCRSIIVPLTGEFQAGSAEGLPSPLPGFGIAPPVVLQMLERVAGGRQSEAA